MLNRFRARVSPPVLDRVMRVMGGLLVQDRDSETTDREDMEIVSARAPTDQEWQDFIDRINRRMREDSDSKA